jgi:hypothetical protein
LVIFGKCMLNYVYTFSKIKHLKILEAIILEVRVHNIALTFSLFFTDDHVYFIKQSKKKTVFRTKQKMPPRVTVYHYNIFNTIRRFKMHSQQA